MAASEEHIEHEEDNNSEISEYTEEKRSKVTKLEQDESKAGVIYLSRIPTLMNVKILRQMMEQYGEVGRIFLQPDGN